MKVGLVGKPNVGKSTFFAAATLAEAAIGNYPFTTIQPNHGVAYVRVPDPGPAMKVVSTPRHGRVAGGTRYVPVEVVDVAGLVPGAHEGRGLGNKFLADLAQADVLVHVVDASGGTDPEGNVLPQRGHDPAKDLAFLPDEMDWWIEGLLADGWDRVAKRTQMEGRKVEAAIAEKLGGIGVSETLAARGLREAGLAGKKAVELEANGLLALAKALRRASKPMVVALNKADLAAPAELVRLEAAAGVPAVRTSAQSELALQKASQAGLVSYHAGEGSFDVRGTLSAPQQKGLDYIRDHVLKPLGSTGVAQALETAVLGLLHRIPVFPVEDETKLTDKEGRVLPDCHLVPPGTTARQLAYKVHTDLGEHFIRAIDCRTHRAIGADHELKTGDIVKIFAKA
ncbi:MAG TPA: redox-regulated ATPase YchF [Candidatus Thermoplasmatota archaeon]|nr:redox-regulated ATPase YchF [Candidatus Thermoplasmatota archaeon]